MPVFHWALIMSLIACTACAPRSVNKRRYRITQDQLDPGTRSSDPARPDNNDPVSPGNPPPFSQGNASNIFQNAAFFIDNSYLTNLKAAATKLPQAKTRIEELYDWGGTGIWLDSRAAIDARLKPAIAEAKEQSLRSGKSVVLSVVIYDLPNRDCYALASNGELLLDANGLQIYQSEYIDPIAAIVQQNPELRFALIVEPDSLPNAITNAGRSQGGEGCSERVLNAYKTGVTYAIKRLAQANTAIYIDAAHSGWLGYNADSRQKMVAIIRELAQAAGGLELIRGLASNVANYTPLEQHEALPLPSNAPYKPYFAEGMIRNELQYIEALAQEMKAQGFASPHFIIDTGRNGEAKSRSVFGNWCNIARARIGERPRVDPRPLIDAYLWVKPPGESDGSAQPPPPGAPAADANKKADQTCAYVRDISTDALDGAPVAGQWFMPHFENLIRQPGQEAPNLGRVGE